MAALAVAVLASLALGTKPLPPAEVVTALLGSSEGDAAVIVRDVRLPRTITAVLVGAGLAVAGALMQGLTRNPLADPGLLGINAGAAFALVVAASLLGVRGVAPGAAFAFVGAAGAALLVYSLSRSGVSPATPVRLTLVGVAVAALFASLTSGVVIGDREIVDMYRFWVIGSLSGRDLAVTGQLAPFVAVGLALAWVASHRLDTLAMGEEAAVSLGTSLAHVQLTVGVAVVLLAGAATAAAGPLVFAGLVVPHLLRRWTGPRYVRLVPAAMLGGPVLMLTADTLGRLLIPPSEIPVGIMLAAIGGPVFVALIRRDRPVAA